MLQVKNRIAIRKNHIILVVVVAVVVFMIRTG